MLTWLELGFPAYVAPSPAASLMARPTAIVTTATQSYLGTSSDDGHLYFVGGAPAAVLDLGLATTWLDDRLQVAPPPVQVWPGAALALYKAAHIRILTSGHQTRD
jgi:hypothetical protein